MKLTRFLLHLLVSVQSLAISVVVAANPSVDSYYFTKRIGTEQGLTNPAITSIHTGADGTVWIGTRYLLNKYVNGELVSYTVKETGGSFITMIYEDSKNQIWIGTERSLMKYDGETDTFLEVCSERINCAVEYKGNYYFAGKGDIVRYDHSSNTFTKIPSATSNIIKVFVFSENILLFIDKYSGLFYLNVVNGTMAKLSIPEIDNSTILSACLEDSCLYVGVFFKGVFVLDQNGQIVRRYLVDDFPDLRLEAICDISKIGGKICLATDGSSICTIDGDNIVPLTKIQGYSGLTNLPLTTTVVTEDSFSNIWVGSVRNGITGIKPTLITSNNKYISLNRSEGKNFAILSLARTDDNLWLGSEGGLFRYSASTGRYVLERDFRNDIITSIVPFSNDAILVSSYCKGLFVLDTKLDRKTRFVLGDLATNKKEILSGYNIELFHLNGSEILITGKNVYRYDWKTCRTDALMPDYGIEPSGLHLFYVSDDKSEAFAFSQDAFCRIDLLRNRISLLNKPNEQNKINTAVCLDGKIYFGTDDGLNRYDVQSGDCGVVNAGLFGRVTHTCIRNDNCIWVASNNILYSLDTNTGLVEVFDEAEGFSTKEVQASEKMDGHFYFGGIDNISEVPSDIHSRVNNMPYISLLGVYVDNNNQEIKKNGTIRIPYKHDMIDIQFVLKGEDPFRRTMMKYSISGPESNNIETNNFTYSLSRLSSGKYSVYASYLRSDGMWSDPVKYVSLIVSEPFWQRGWFLLSIIAFFALISLSVINRNAQKTKKQLQSAIQENKDIENEKRYRFIIGIESEFAKPIARIKKLSRSILEDDSVEEKLIKSVEKIYDNSAYLEKMMEISIRQERPANEENPILNKFNKIIDERISDQNLDVSVLVKEMAMSRTGLYDKIKDLSGMGINEYIQNRRLMLARKMLIETDMSITEISDELGFSSSKYFSEIFKKAYEISPREFRKRIMEKSTN